MLLPRVFRQRPKRASLRPKELRRWIVTQADVDQARSYCLNQLRYGPQLMVDKPWKILTCNRPEKETTRRISFDSSSPNPLATPTMLCERST